jgi:hypothetical protein
MPATHVHAYALLGTKWDPGPNSASAFSVAPGTPGSASWSLMPANVGLDAAILNPGSPLHDPDHSPPILTLSSGALLGTASTSEEIAAVNAALNVWAAVSGFTNLGMVSDGGAAGGAPMVLGGHSGDIRIGAFSFSVGVLAGTFRPGTELMSLGLGEGQGGTIGGDIHMNVGPQWVDEANDLLSDPDIDFFTVMLHELGHALGLGHSTVTTAVMFPNYTGGQRSLDPDDIAGIQAIYGANAAPEPGSHALLALGFLLAAALAARRNRVIARAP